MKKILTAAGGLAAALIITGCVREIIWHQFEPPQIISSTLTYRGEDAEEASRRWLVSYFEKMKGWTVPYSYRIADVKITDSEILDELPEQYVQLEYSVCTASANDSVIGSLELAGTEARRVYTGQILLNWKKSGTDTWEIRDKLRPVEYQIQTPEFQKEMQEPQTQHYKMETDEPMTYFIHDGVLYVTYDSGETLTEVPDGYDKVCMDTNGRYVELLTDGSYIITPEFTAFVGYSDGTPAVIYSTDQGQTWQESSIHGNGHRANTFLSKTPDKCYVTFAVDRSLGSDYYATFVAEDMQNWTRIDIPEAVWSNLSCAFWTDDGYGYYAKGNSAVRITMDGSSESNQIIQIPEAVEVTAGLGFNPFDTIENIYQEEQSIYMVVGQGDDGDYVKDGKLMKALYQSQDGVNFTFVKEVLDDSPEEAG